jgi:flagellar biosynthesis/type III secretory pathway chaperone
MESLTNLYHLLDTETCKYQELIKLTKLEQQALQEENLENLSKLVDQKAKLVDTIFQHDKDREQAVITLASTFDLSGTVSLTEIIACLDPKAQEEFAKMQAKLLSLIEEFFLLNHANYLLIRSGLSFVEATLGYIVSISIDTDGRYTAQGSGSSPPRTANNIVNWIA